MARKARPGPSTQWGSSSHPVISVLHAGRARCSLLLPWAVARDVKIRQEKFMFGERKPKAVHKSHLCFLLSLLGNTRKERALRK